MGSSSAEVPPPPPFSSEEQAYLRGQNLTLDKVRGLLGDQTVNQQETYNMLKGLSGLYSSYDIPEKPGEVKRLKQGDLDALAHYSEHSLDTARGWSSKSSAFNRRGTEVATDLRQAHPELANMRIGDIVGKINSDPKFAVSVGFAEQAAATPASKGYKVNQDAVNALKGKLDDFQKKQEELTQKSMGAQGQALDNLRAELEQNLKLQQDTYTKLQEELNKGPSELDQAQQRVGLLQAERLEKALKGELPVSEATQQRKAQEFNLLKESLSRRGIRLQGDSPETAVSNSTAGNEAVGEFNRTYGLLQDAERRGEITSGAGINQGQYGLLSNVGNQNLSQMQSIRSLSGSPASYSSFAPGSTSLGLMSGAQAYSPGTLLPAYSGLMNNYGMAMQPYSAQRNLQYQAQLQNAALQMQGQGAMSGLLGQAGGMGLMSGNPWGMGIGAGLLGAGYLFGR
jgi:hypothetical protein